MEQEGKSEHGIGESEKETVSNESLVVKVQVIGLPKSGKSIISSIIYKALSDQKVNVIWDGDEDYNLRDGFREMDKSKFNVSLIEISTNRTPLERK